MLYCPKCQQKYEEGSQRFCNNDGGRLLPVSNAEKSQSAAGGGVFTNLLSRGTVNQERDEKLAAIPRFVKAEAEPEPIPQITSIFESDADEIELELDPPVVSRNEVVLDFDPADAPTVELPRDLPGEWSSSTAIMEEPAIKAENNLTPVIEAESPFARPLARIIRPEEIPAGHAEIGNRQTNPIGRNAFTWETTDVMLGQTVKGRYLITDQTDQDESSISFLADDKLVPNKKVVVRILMDEEYNDDFTNKIYEEERISFSHINHPNVIGVIDSGELQEGNSFVITEYVEGHSVKDVLEKTGPFNLARTARIIRQAAYAMSEMHQNRVLHRNLKPGNIILTFPGSGSEQVKITGFCAGSAKTGEDELVYKAPEVLEGQIATNSSDVFSLGVIAYEMLTHRTPFSGSNAKQMLKSQRGGVHAHATNTRMDLPPLADNILEKAMAANAVERYPKARDFGDAFFNALTTVSPWTDEREDEIPDARNYQVLQPLVASEPANIPMPPLPLILAETEATEEDVYEIPDEDVGQNVHEVQAEPGLAPEPVLDDPQWTKRSPEPPKSSSSWLIFAGLGAVILVGGIWAWSYFLSQPNPPAYTPPKTAAAQNTKDGPPITEGQDAANLPANEAGDVPPPARNISQPPNTTFYQSSKQNLTGDLSRNFVQFSLFYPNDWKVNQASEGTQGARGKFLDISRNAPNGKLAEQMLISYYESRGTINADADKFPQMVKETNETLKKLIPGYQMLSEGRKDINGWPGYEVKFQGGGTTDTGEKLNVWGRRLFIPAARPGVKNGFEITMLATSYADGVISVDDVGNKGGLATVLATFEPGK